MPCSRPSYNLCDVRYVYVWPSSVRTGYIDNFWFDSHARNGRGDPLCFWNLLGTFVREGEEYCERIAGIVSAPGAVLPDLSGQLQLQKFAKRQIAKHTRHIPYGNFTPPPFSTVVNIVFGNSHRNLRILLPRSYIFVIF